MSGDHFGVDVLPVLCEQLLDDGLAVQALLDERGQDNFVEKLLFGPSGQMVLQAKFWRRKLDAEADGADFASDRGQAIEARSIVGDHSFGCA